jgi:hypothetical protein
MRLRRLSFACAMALMCAATGVPATAAVAPITNPGVFGGAGAASFAALPSGEIGAVTLFEATPLAITLTAPGGLFADGAGVLSTVLDLDAMIVTSAAGARGLGFYGGVVDETFEFVAGRITLTTGGQTFSIDSIAGAPVFFGLLGDETLGPVRIAVGSFDPDATSVAFVGLTAVTVAPIPLPWSLLLLGTAMIGLSADAVRPRRASRSDAAS